MKYASNTRKLMLSRFFHGLIPAYVIERLFWEQRGITVTQVVYCEIVYAVAVILFEIPTGVLADKWSRKGLLVVGAIAGCLEFLILVYASGFWQFALVAFLTGVGTAASSGSENALLYDSLANCERQHEFEMYLGRINGADFAASVIAAMSGGLLAGRYGFELNYWMSMGSMILCLVFTLLLREPSLAARETQSFGVLEYVTASLRFFRSRRGVGHIVLAGTVLGASITYLDEFWQLYLKRLTVPVPFYGLFAIGLYLGRIPGNVLAFRFLRKVGHKTLLAATAALFALGFALMAHPGVLGAVAMVIVSSCYGLVEPVVSGYLHHRVDSQIRATVDSFQSLGLRGIGIAVGLLFGYAARSSILRGYGFLSIMCGAYLCWFLVQRIEPTERDSRSGPDSAQA